MPESYTTYNRDINPNAISSEFLQVKPFNLNFFAPNQAITSFLNASPNKKPASPKNSAPNLENPPISASKTFAPKTPVIPSFQRQPAYAFAAPELELFHELSAVSEEIGRLRAAKIGEIR